MVHTAAHGNHRVGAAAAAPAVGVRAEVHVVRLDPPAETFARLGALLSAAEWQRANAFCFERDRRRYVASHAAVRAILAERLGVEPQALEFEAGPYGKPRLVGGGRLAFSLAHSGELALCGVTEGVEIGVDVEQLREVPDAEGILRANFTAAELDDWLATPAEARCDAFLRLWTCKEAWLKACGLGLSLPIHHSDVSLSGGRGSFRSVNGSSSAAQKWTLRTFEPASGYVAAVCVEAPGADLRPRRWTEPV